MLKSVLLNLFGVLLFCTSIQAQNLDYYLPKANIKYNPQIPTPKSVLGHEVGEFHVTHDKLVYYLQKLAEVSDRMSIETYAYTHEKRPLLLLTISSPENHANLEAIQQAHLELSNPQKSASLTTQNMPAVVWQGYSVHGNEASGANAALVLAYYLAAADGEKIDKLLKNTIILLDPVYNPDGLNRFATWVNMHKSKNLNTDPNSREFHEVWPGGRTNHYWFDLNRDWLLVQQPESKGRITKFHEWKPNILTDHHEMGSNSSFFFQPGVPERTNPITPVKNQEITAKIAEFHAKALDKIGSFYYSKESFDDFYYGKGSTYPDVNGGIGILFEQASSRGHAQETQNGVLTFPFAIRNHFTTSLSTLEAAQNLRVELLDYQREFYQQSTKLANENSVKSYVFGDKYDRTRNFHFIELLQKHQIEVYDLKENLKIDKQTFDKNTSYIVPLNQAQHRLIKGIFEKQTSFRDSIFYDVSSWTLPHAFGIPFAELNTKDSQKKGSQLIENSFPEGKLHGERTNYAYLFEWDEYYAPRALNKILSAGLRAKVAQAPFTHNRKSFDRGTILIPVTGQELDGLQIHTLMQELSSKNGLDIYTTKEGLTSEGVDLGSPNFSALKAPKILLVVGDGVRSYDAGEVWHLLDERFEMSPSMVEAQNIERTDLSKYNVLIMVAGSYSKVNLKAKAKIRGWVRRGNTLILNNTAVSWAKNNTISSVEFANNPTKKDSTDAGSFFRPYASRAKDKGSQRIGGAIFEAEIDLSHPICYGYNTNKISVFRNHTFFVKKSKNAYNTPVRYTSNPLLSGYISDKNLSKIENTASVVVTFSGSGKVINMVDNPNFRAFWYGTNKLFMNAIFFGHIVRP
jgi:hypothetical protein